MKRYGHLFEKICDIENLRLAHLNARRGKRHYCEVRMVDRNPDFYLRRIETMLQDRSYRTSSYMHLVKHDGRKDRDIFVLPYYPDRIVHWAIVQVLEPIWMRTLIGTTYASLKGRGVHAGLIDLQEALRDREGSRYCLKFDIRKFYESVDHVSLKGILREKIKDPEVLRLLDEIVDSVGEERGIPIGNYLSQFFGNLYLNRFDHWMKEEKQVRHYFRYCDDCVAFHSDKEILHRLRSEAVEYLDARLGLTMKGDWQVFPTTARGVDFLGYRSFGGRILLRRSTALRLKRRMRKIASENVVGDAARSSIASYQGWLQWCDGCGLEEKYIMPLLEGLT